MMPARQSNLLSIQVLRAVAALFVVAYHACELGTTKLTGSAMSIWDNGSAGVDIFFVISGLVMGLSTERLVHQAGAGLTFLRQRLIRIIPMYWLVTTAKIAAVVILPQFAMRTQLNLPYILSSYALLPLHDAAGDFKPVLPVGWTLTYEMFFYLLVASALFLRRPILSIAAPVLVVTCLLAIARQPEWPIVADFANPIVLEFLYGVLIALVLRRGRQLPAGLAVLALICGTSLIVTVPVISGLLRPIVWGLPAAMMVVGAASLEPILAPRMPRWLLACGNASYSIYLTHAFVLPVLWLVIIRFGRSPDIALAAMVIGSLLVSALTGWVTYIAIERPLTRRLAGRQPRWVASQGILAAVE